MALDGIHNSKCWLVEIIENGTEDYRKAVVVTVIITGKRGQYSEITASVSSVHDLAIYIATYNICLALHFSLIYLLGEKIWHKQWQR